MSDLILKDPKFDALRNAIYHTERCQFFAFANRCLSFLVILFSAGIAAKWARHVHLDDTWIELAVVAAATIQLVFDFGGASKTHEFLQRRYYELVAEMEGQDLADEAARRSWSAKIFTIAAEEPMTMRALDAIAYNKALDAMYAPEDKAKYRQRVSNWQYCCRHFFAYQDADFSPATDHAL